MGVSNIGRKVGGKEGRRVGGRVEGKQVNKKGTNDYGGKTKKN